MRLSELRERSRALGFTPRDQVRWLAPAELMRTVLQVAIASAFSSFTDKRELQRSFPDEAVALPPDEQGGCWIDHVADLGDGFDPTYSVAWLLAAEQLRVDAPDDRPDLAPVELPRGRLLVFGGDGVYPVASRDGYADRTRGPYRSALPENGVTGERPLLIALPGNHDWYDGLTAFLRTFGQRRAIGGWQTVQGRSYFCVQLPHRWWLVGLDSQFGDEIDDPQLDYFRERLTARLEPGDGVILCTAAPMWVDTVHDAGAFDSLHYFERNVVRHRVDPDTGRKEETGAEVRLWITGDLHHYARYAEQPTGPAGPAGADAPGEARQLVTCGLGGAYLATTHRLPGSLDLPPPGSAITREGETARFELERRWPDEAASRRMVGGLLAPPPRGLPFRNPGFWRLAGGVHAALFVLLASVLGVRLDLSPADAVRAAAVGDVAGMAGELGIWFALGLLGYSLLPLVRRRRPRLPSAPLVGIGLQFGIGFLGLLATVLLVRAIVLPDWLGGPRLPDFLMFGLAFALSGVVLGLVGSYGVALTIALSRAEVATDWQASAQAIEDHKGFVRIRIDADGSLRLHPVVIDDICRDWTLEDGPDGFARPVPAQPLRPRLVEEPVVITRSPRAGGALPQPPPRSTAAGPVRAGGGPGPAGEG